MKKIILILSLILIPVISFACHQGGSMGYASGSPLSSSIDYTFFPTMMTASTSGTLGCQNWDVVMNEQADFIEIAGSFLEEDISKGSGQHLLAFAGVMQCNNPQLFGEALRFDYNRIYLPTKVVVSKYEMTHDILEKIRDLRYKSTICE